MSFTWFVQITSESCWYSEPLVSSNFESKLLATINISRKILPWQPRLAIYRSLQNPGLSPRRNSIFDQNVSNMERLKRYMWILDLLKYSKEKKPQFIDPRKYIDALFLKYEKRLLSAQEKIIHKSAKFTHFLGCN